MFFLDIISEFSNSYCQVEENAKIMNMKLINDIRKADQNENCMLVQSLNLNENQVLEIQKEEFKDSQVLATDNFGTSSGGNAQPPLQSNFSRQMGKGIPKLSYTCSMGIPSYHSSFGEFLKFFQIQ